VNSPHESSNADSPDRRPLDLASGQPLPAREQPGYYPGFSTLSQQSYWDAATRRKVLERVMRSRRSVSSRRRKHA
jgi:hypothetical protein